MQERRVLDGHTRCRRRGTPLATVYEGLSSWSGSHGDTFIPRAYGECVGKNTRVRALTLRRGILLALAGFLALLPSAAVGGCTSTHSVPEIVSLESGDRVIAPGDSVLIECVAVSADGGDLDYQWDSDRGTLNGHDGTYAWTAPEQEGVARITVTVTNRAGVAVSESIAIVVKKNTPPVIAGVAADRGWVPPAGTVTLSCAAEDVDGDELTYTWSSDCGEIDGEGPSVTWTAPLAERECIIFVEVDDGYEGRARASLSIVVSVTEPLLVTHMEVTAVDNPRALVFSGGRYTIYRGASMIVRAIVNKREMVVSYEWTDGGTAAVFPVGSRRIRFEGGPEEIRWTAPEGRGDYTITAIVKGEGEEAARRSILVSVETCLPCM